MGMSGLEAGLQERMKAPAVGIARMPGTQYLKRRRRFRSETLVRHGSPQHRTEDRYRALDLKGQDPLALRDHIVADVRMLNWQRAASLAAVDRILFAKHGRRILGGATLYGVAHLGDVIALCLEGQRKDVTAQPTRMAPSHAVPRPPADCARKTHGEPATGEPVRGGGGGGKRVHEKFYPA